MRSSVTCSTAWPPPRPKIRRSGDPEICSIGVDSWAVDYALIGGGRMLAAPFPYRDDRTVPAIQRVHALAPSEELYAADDPGFLSPGDMPERIARWCVSRGLQPPQTRVEFVRSIIESLSVAFVTAVHAASELSGKPVSVIHIVGGGSQNELLCQLLADRSGMPVLAGPVEATAIGNVLVQARAQGLVTGSLESLRALVATAFSPTRYSPH